MRELAERQVQAGIKALRDIEGGPVYPSDAVYGEYDRRRVVAVLQTAADLRREYFDRVETLEATLTDLRQRSVEEGIHHFVKLIDDAMTFKRRGDT